MTGSFWSDLLIGVVGALLLSSDAFTPGVCVDEFVNGWIWVQVGGPLHVPYCPCPVFLLKTVLLAEPVGDLIADVRVALRRSALPHAPGQCPDRINRLPGRTPQRGIVIPQAVRQPGSYARLPLCER